VAYPQKILNKMGTVWTNADLLEISSLQVSSQRYPTRGHWKNHLGIQNLFRCWPSIIILVRREDVDTLLQSSHLCPGW
jgi:hypothetical protein